MKALLERFSGKKLTLTSTGVLALLVTYSELEESTRAECWPWLAVSVAGLLGVYALAQALVDSQKK